jgi:hypothetical protein
MSDKTNNLQEWETIKNETVSGANTATRVGTAGENTAKLVAAGISYAQVDELGIPTQSSTTSYSQVKLTNQIPYQSDTDVIEVKYDVNGCDEILIKKSGIFKFRAIFFIEGANQRELYIKQYVNGSPTNAGDPVGVNLEGSNKPVALPFTGILPVVAGTTLTFWGKMDSSDNFDVVGGNYSYELTQY